MKRGTGVLRYALGEPKASSEGSSNWMGHKITRNGSAMAFLPWLPPHQHRLSIVHDAAPALSKATDDENVDTKPWASPRSAPPHSPEEEKAINELRDIADEHLK
jgi:hypothetical protein